jgi:hypothetical protein
VRIWKKAMEELRFWRRKMTGRELLDKLNYLGMERGVRELALEEN